MQCAGGTASTEIVGGRGDVGVGRVGEAGCVAAPWFEDAARKHLAQHLAELFAEEAVDDEVERKVAHFQQVGAGAEHLEAVVVVVGLAVDDGQHRRRNVGREEQDDDRRQQRHHFPFLSIQPSDSSIAFLICASEIISSYQVHPISRLKTKFKKMMGLTRPVPSDEPRCATTLCSMATCWWNRAGRSLSAPCAAGSGRRRGT